MSTARSPMPASDPSPLSTALRFLGEGYWPIPIHPWNSKGQSPGKRPIGVSWGKERPTVELLTATYRRYPEAGVGLLLGPDGGLMDIDVDAPESAGEALARMFPDGEPETLGWANQDGRRHLLFRWHPRLVDHGLSLVKGFLNPKGEIGGNLAYLGLEVRIGATDKQLQTVIPPSLMANGQARRWNAHGSILDVPASLLADLDAFANPKPVAVEAMPGTTLVAMSGRRWSPEQRAAAYLDKCDPAVSGSAGHNAAFSAACKVGPGFNLAPQDAYRLMLASYNPRCDPPWSEKELRHKVDEAYKVETRRGWFLEVDDRPRLPSPITIPFPGVVSSNPNEAQPNEAADDPSRLARLHLDAHCRQGDDLTLLFRQGDFLDWDGAYRQCPQEHLRAVLHSTIKAEFNRLNLVALAIHDREKIAEAAPGEGKEGEAPKEKKDRPTVRKVTGALVSNTMLALSGYTRIEPRIAEPSWLRGPGPFSADDVLPMRNALVHLPSLVAGDPAAIHPPTPRYYCPYCLDYSFDADAPEPTRWLEFMQSVFPRNPESIDTLQEWFGHMLTPDTSQQKILMIIGPKRSGKGTVARLLRGMLSPENVANPSLGGLATNFGLAPLIGKPAAIITDARLSGRTDIAQIVERLLSISGEDAVTIDRKHMSAVTVKLPSRFTFISNELPRLTDTSGALAGRMLILPMRESFYNREDTRLTATLMTELPGILLWAIAGWQRLRERGWFVQPEAGVAMVEQLEDLGSPVGAFLKERCRIEPGGETMAANLYQAWKAWCAERGRDNAGDELGFGRNLHAILPNLKVTSRRQSDGNRKRFYEGIYLDKRPANFD